MQRYMLSIFSAICLLASWAYAVLSVVAGLIPEAYTRASGSEVAILMMSAVCINCKQEAIAASLLYQRTSAIQVFPMQALSFRHLTRRQFI